MLEAVSYSAMGGGRWHELNDEDDNHDDQQEMDEAPRVEEETRPRNLNTAKIKKTIQSMVISFR